MSIPRATMRLQFHNGFTFDDAVAIIPYIADLGISHLYASPILTARAGSMHGYDVIDPMTINLELGGEEGFRRLVAALRNAGLGIIIDIVPNHMAVGRDNAWWMDVLEYGRASKFAHYFDIDWEPDDPALKDKVLLPILGRPFGEALQDGEISLAFNDTLNRHEIRYFEHTFPVSSVSRSYIEESGLETFDATTDERTKLQGLLERQHYRLAWWRSANDAINWRRFFDINELAAMRVEDEDVFDATHAKILGLFAEGLIDGVRIDHIDGLADPKTYCRRLRARLEAQRGGTELPYIVVEKILGAGEELPEDWHCDGTSGYDFMDQLSRILHDARGKEPLTRWWAAISGQPQSFAIEEEACRREILDRSFAAQLEAAVSSLHRVAEGDLATRDFARPALRRGLIEILIHMRVYRTYASVDAASVSDGRLLGEALARALTTCLPQDRAAVTQIAVWLGDGARAAGDPPLQRAAIQRFQQLSAPLAAKAVEDTAFYRYAPLLSRNDVGFDPNHFANEVEDFHRECLARAKNFPHAMLASATHDHKRGEDVRARLAVLSEMPDEWVEQQSVWLRDAAPFFSKIDGSPAPSLSDATILFQMLVGAWPLDLGPNDTNGLRNFADRIAAWQLKALREAKLATDWIAPNEAYETAADAFLRALLSGDWPAKFAAFADSVAAAGAVDGLTQTLLKLTVPGVPDIYQGTEFWDQSLVDPDNRRPVDFFARRKTLSTRKSVLDLADDWRDGAIKQALMRTILTTRKSHPALFAEGAYCPLHVEGAAVDHLIAFARRNSDDALIVLATRLPLRMLGDGLHIPASSWDDTRVKLPADLAGKPLLNLLSDRPTPTRADQTLVAELLDDFPLAVFMPTPAAVH